jgi:hypothetical protein
MLYNVIIILVLLYCQYEVFFLVLWPIKFIESKLLIKFIDKYKVLSESQYGFTRNKSTD